MSDHIIKQNTRILTPNEYEALRGQMSPLYQVLCDALLFSGMRPIEFSRFRPEWYKPSRRSIHLPRGACLKKKCQYTERTILLSLPGCDAFDNLLNLQFRRKGTNRRAYEIQPARVSFGDTLKRYAEAAGIGTEGISPKMFRKTLASWYVAVYPEKLAFISASMGHDPNTLIKHYLGMGFTREELETIRTKYIPEWGVAA